MTELQKQFEATGYASWINSDAYPDGRIYTQEYTQWLEKQLEAKTQDVKLLVDAEAQAFAGWIANQVIAGRTYDKLWLDYKVAKKYNL